MTQAIINLQATKLYLATIGAVYPVAPEKAIASVEAAITEISDLSMRLTTARNILEMIQVATTDDNARAAAASALKAIQP